MSDTGNLQTVLGQPPLPSVGTAGQGLDPHLQPTDEKTKAAEAKQHIQDIQ